MATEHQPPPPPEHHITPWLEETFRLVDAACDRWERRRARLARRKKENERQRTHALQPADVHADLHCHSDE